MLTSRDGPSGSRNSEVSTLPRTDARLPSSADVWTIPHLPADPRERAVVLTDPEAWLPERRQLHTDLLTILYQECEQLSASIGKGLTPDAGLQALIARGGPSVGKTTFLASPRAAGVTLDAFDGTNLSAGALSPDTIRRFLALHDKSSTPDRPIALHQYAEEGNLLMAHLMERAVGSLHLAFDRVLATPREFLAVVQRLGNHGYRIFIVDLDVGFSTAVSRAKERDSYSHDLSGNPAYFLKVHESIRAHRADILRELPNLPAVRLYTLLASEPERSFIPVATWSEGALRISAATAHLLREFTSPLPDSMKAAAYTELSDHFGRYNHHQGPKDLHYR